VCRVAVAGVFVDCRPVVNDDVNANVNVNVSVNIDVSSVSLNVMGGYCLQKDSTQ